uniref:RGD motif, leucine rich repeats, tropomodulin domain and proline-rich containing n=3 Tax=Iconisemion striatum TaxID=60296 RepID=A0A1A7X7T0_9TELE
MEGEVVTVDAAGTASEDTRASLNPPPSPTPIYSFPTRVPKEEAVGRGGLHEPEAPFPHCSPHPVLLSGFHSSASPMESLPTQGQTLRHYTASRPRPQRTHRQPPSYRPQEQVSEEKDEANEAMGRVDEGVEEFFTKKIISDYAPKGQWEESNPAQATSPESSPTPSSTTPFFSPSDIVTPSATTVTSPCVESDVSFPSPDVPTLCTTHLVSTTITVPTKNIKKRFGDFFAFKRARVGRAAKTGGGDDAGVEVVKVKKSSIADLIRPLREAKERERDKERKRERGKGSEEDANSFYDTTVKEETVFSGCHLESYVREKILPAKTLTTPTQLSETPPSYPTITKSPDLATPVHPKLEDAAVPVASGHKTCPEVISPLTEQEMLSRGTSFGQKRLRVTKRLREGKSQSLILLTGLEPDEKDNTPSKKHASENTSGFEQKLQVMLQRMSTARTPPACIKLCQNRDEELRKANSEGAILDKPEPPPTYTKPRTMSTPSAEPRRLLKAQDPTGPEPHTAGLLPSIPPKTPLPTPAACPSSAPAASSPTERVLRTAQGHIQPTPQNGSQHGAQGAPPTLPPRKEVFSSVQARWSEVSAQDRSEKAQSVTEDSLPKPCPRLKPLPQRRAVSVHEDALAMTQELKAVLQRSPIRFQGNRWDLPSCNEDEAQTGDSGKRWHKEKDTDQLEELKAKGGRMGFSSLSAENKNSLQIQEGSLSHSPKANAQQEATAPGTSPKVPSTSERLSDLTQTAGKSPGPVAPRGTSPCTVSPPLQEKIPSTTPTPSKCTETLQVSSQAHKNQSAAPEQGHSSPDLSEPHTKLSEPAEPRTETPPSE